MNSYVAALARQHDLHCDRPVWQAAGAQSWTLTVHCSQWSASATLDAAVLNHAFRGEERDHASVVHTIRLLVRALASAVLDPAK